MQGLGVIAIGFTSHWLKNWHEISSQSLSIAIAIIGLQLLLHDYFWQSFESCFNEASW